MKIRACYAAGISMAGMLAVAHAMAANEVAPLPGVGNVHQRRSAATAGRPVRLEIAQRCASAKLPSHCDHCRREDRRCRLCIR